MTNKGLFKFSFILLQLGWFPFMWLSVWGSWNREWGVVVLLVGLLICMLGAISAIPLMQKDDLFKTIDELEKERAELKEKLDHVDKIISVVGKHEAIKLWEESKKK